MTAKLSSEFDYIAVNVARIKERAAAAAIRSGRAPENITIVAVTKTMPAEAVNAALSAGINVIGENRVQELLDKLPGIDVAGRSVHLIGHLQTNKASKIVDKVNMIQSLDSLRLAHELDSQCAKRAIDMETLVEVNIGRESSKSGVLPEELSDFLDDLAQFKHLKVCGLMSIPPVCQKKEETRPYFKEIHKLFIDISAKKSDNINMHILSMGMSADFDIAIEEGATMVRIGTAIFGSRKK